MHPSVRQVVVLGEFDPLTLPWAALWVPRSDNVFTDTGRTTLAAAGQEIAAIGDLSGNGRHLTQSTATKLPIFRQTGGLNSAEFDGSNDFMSSTSFGVAQPNTFAAAVKIANASGSTGNVLDGSTVRQIMGATTGNAYRIFAASTVSGGTRDTAAHTMIALFNGASSSLIIDNNAAITGDAGTQAINAGVKVGSDNAGTSQFFSGQFYGGGVLTRALTAAEQANLRAWLAGLAGT